MPSKSATIFVTVLLMLCSQQALALRCGSKIVNRGDRMHQVIEACGDPDFVDYYDRTFNYYPYQFVHVEIWTYNFGPRKFMQELIFEYGRLQLIHPLGYGYN